MKNKIVTFLTIVIASLLLVSCSQKVELKALVLTGQNNHNWKGSSPVLKSILEKSGVFQVEIKTSPAKKKDMSGFIVDFSPYDVVVLDYYGDDWPNQTKDNFVNYVKNGGGVVVYHAADNAFPDWPEFNEIIGVGGWEDRDEKSGPYVYVEAGEVVRDNSPGSGGSHGSQHEFVVEAYQPEHPITVSEILQINDGHLLIATLGNGIFEFDPVTGQFGRQFTADTSEEYSINHNKVNDLFLDKSGLLWIATDSGINTYDFRQQQFTNFKSSNAVWAIAGKESGNTDKVFIGSGNSMNTYQIDNGKIAE